MEQCLGEAVERAGYKTLTAKPANFEDWMSFAVQRGDWTCVQYQQFALDWAKTTREVGTRLKAPAFFFQICDGDWWGYRFYDRGEELAKFVSMPAACEEAERPEDWTGNAKAVAASLGLKNAASFEKHLVHLDAENPRAGKAYRDDQFEMADPWAVGDFMAKLGILWEDKESQGSMLYLVKT